MPEKSISEVKVLIAEDNEVNQLLIRTLLEEQGWHVTIVENGKECVDRLCCESFTFVLMDIQMPVMDGLEAAKRIRNELHMDVPIIGTSANADQEDVRKSLEAGMNGHMSKFFSTTQLKEVLRQWLT